MNTPSESCWLTNYYEQYLATGRLEHAEAILREFICGYEDNAVRLQLDLLLIALKNKNELLSPAFRNELVYFFQQSVLLYKALQALYTRND